MEPLTVSNETFQQAICWINGEESDLHEKDVRELIMTLSNGFRSAFRRMHPDGPVPRLRTYMPNPLSLSSLMGEAVGRQPKEAEVKTPVQAVEREERPEPPREEAVPPPAAVPDVEKGQEPAALDSVALVNAIGYVSMRSGVQMTQSRAQIILYCLYGSRLGAGKERLGIEHPQMWKYGPVFPRAYKRSSLGDFRTCETSYRELAERFPDVLTRLEAKTSSMMNTAMCDLSAVHKGERSPYGRLLRRNPSRWGLQIPDEDIAKFFKENSV